MSIGTPVVIGSATPTANSGTTAIVTTGPVAKGDAIVVAFAQGGTVTLSSLADTSAGGQSWTIYNLTPAGGQRFSGFAVAIAGEAIASGITITLTWSGSNIPACVVLDVPCNGLTLKVDVTAGTGPNTTSTAPSCPSGVLTYGNELLIGVIANQNSGGSPASSSWTAVTGGQAHATGQVYCTTYSVAPGATEASQTLSATIANVFWSVSVLSIWGSGASIAGAGSLTAAAVLEPVASLAGVGSVTAAAAQEPIAAITGTGSLSAASVAEAIAAISGTGSLTAAEASLITGAGSLTAAPSVQPAAAITGAGTIADLEETSSVAGAGTLTADPVQEPLAAITGTGSLTAQPSRPGTAVVTLLGADGTFGTLASLITTPSGHSFATQPVDGWQFGDGVSTYYTKATPDGQVVISTIGFVANELRPTADHAEIGIYNPADASFARQVIPTSAGNLTAVNTVSGLGGTDVGGGDVVLVTGGDGQPMILTSQSGYYFGWPQASGLYPALAYLTGTDGQWGYDQALSLTGDQWQATNPAVFSVIAPDGQAAGNGFDYWSPAAADQMAVLASGDVVIGHYFGFGAGAKSGGLSVIAADGTLLAAYQIPAMTPLSGTLTLAAVRDVQADPASDPGGIQYLAVIYDSFGTGPYGGKPVPAIQVFSYDPSTQAIAPVSVPCIPADTGIVPQYSLFGPDGTLYVSCGQLSNGLAGANMQVYAKHPGTLWNLVSQAPVTPGWETTSWATQVAADNSLGFPQQQQLGGLAGPMQVDPVSGALLVPGISSRLAAAIPGGDPGTLGPNLLTAFESNFEPPQLLSTDDWVFGGSLGTWTAFLGSTSRVMPPVAPPVGSFAMQVTEASGSSIYHTGLYPAVAGDPYQVTVNFLTQATARTCDSWIQWYASDGTTVAGVGTHATISDSHTAWTPCTAFGTAPLNAAYFEVWASVESGGAGENHYIAANTAYDVSAAGWTGFLTNLVIAQLSDGSWALEISAPLSGEVLYAQSPLIAVQPLTEYYAGGVFQAAAATPGQLCKAEIAWFDHASTLISTIACTLSVTDAGTGWAQASCGAMSPASAVYAAVALTPATTTAGQAHYARGVTLQAQPWTLIPYVNYELGGLRTLVAPQQIGLLGRPSVAKSILYIPVAVRFSAAEQTAYNSGGYVPAPKPQYMVAVDLRQLIPADVPVPYLAGQGAQSYPATGIPPPGAWSLPVGVAVENPGDWLLAVISWHQAPYGGTPSVSVEDDAPGGRNYWDVLAPAADSPPEGNTITAVWIAPAARIPATVMIAPTGYVPGLAATIIGVPADLISPWVSQQGLVTGYANDAGDLGELALPAPSGPVLAITGCGGDSNGTPLAPGAGWTPFAQTGATNGAGQSADICQRAAWQVTSAGASVSWSSSAAQDLSGVLAAVLLAAPPPQSDAAPSWPGVVKAQIAIGSGAGTAPGDLTWTDLTDRVLAARWRQGRQYTLGQLRAGSGMLTCDNPDLALIPPGRGEFAGIDSGNPWRILLIFPGSPTPYYVWGAGFVQRFPPQWPAGTRRGITVATTTDAWGYCNKLLPSIARAEILADQPLGYWPCGDAQGRTAAANYAPGGGPPLAVVSSKYGPGGNGYAFGSQPNPQLLGDTSTIVTASAQTSSGGGMWEETMASASSGIQAGYSLSAVVDCPPVQDGLTCEMFFQIGNPIQEQGQLLMAWCKSHAPSGTVYPHGILLWIDTPPGSGGTGKLTLFSSFDLTPDINRIGIGGTDYTAGNPPPLTQVAISFNANSWISYVNGQQSATGTWASPLTGKLPYLSVNGAAGLPWPMLGLGSFFASGYSGLAGQAALFEGQLPPGRILSHYHAVLGLAGESPSHRIERLLQAGGVTGRRLILPDTGAWKAPAVSCQDIGGQPAATGLTNIAASTTPAILGVSRTGAPFYAARQYVYNQPVTWILGDDTDAGEIPFLPDFAPDYDPVRVVNNVQVTQLDDQAVMTPQLRAVETASQAQYGNQSAGGQVTGYLANDDVSSGPGTGPGSIDLANWLGNVNSRPGLRIAQFTVDAASHPNAWPFAAGAAPGDLAKLTLRPPTAEDGDEVTVTGRITSIDGQLQFGLDAVVGSLTCVVDLAPEMAVLTAGDPVLGQLNGKNPGAW